MNNSRRWRKLMEWLRYLQDNGLTDKINFERLQKKIKQLNANKD